MPAVVSSIADAGVGDYDGQLKVIEYANEKQSMRWNDTLGLWLTEPRSSFRYKTDFFTSTGGAPTWAYMTLPDGNPGVLGRTGFGWTPQAIHRADAAYAAGLVLYEKIDYLLWTWDVPNDMSVSTVYFNLDPSDMMSTLLSATADDNKGTVIHAVVGSRKMRSTGWVESQIPTPTKSVLAPHLYYRGSSPAGATILEFFSAQWRWVGDPFPGDRITVAADLTGLDNNEILVWDGTDSRFEPGAL